MSRYCVLALLGSLFSGCSVGIGPPEVPMKGDVSFGPCVVGSNQGRVIKAGWIMSHITNAKYPDYTLKSVEIDDPQFARVNGNRSNTKVTLLKAGKFTADIILEHAKYPNHRLKKFEFEVRLPNFHFNKLVRDMVEDHTVSTDGILEQISGAKSRGYQLKSIKVNDISYARITGVKPKLGLELLKVGNFTADIVLEHSNYFDVMVKGVEIEVIPPGFVFNFSRLLRSFADGKRVSTDDILEHIPGAKSKGCKLKSIKVNDISYARITGVKPNLGLELLKVGNFTADIVLEHSNYFDIMVKGVEIEVVPPGFVSNFSKLLRSFGDSKRVSTDDILGHISGAKSKGYKLKSIRVNDIGYARVTGLKPDLGLELLKVGNFTVDIVLEHARYVDVVVKGVEIGVISPDFVFNFDRLFRNVEDGKRVSTDDILEHIPDAKSKGYKLKSIRINDVSYARVTGLKPNLGLELLKVGNFTADIALEHAKYADVVVKGVEMAVISPGLVFNFNRLLRNVEDGTKVSADDILEHIPGAKSKGYKLKSIRVNDVSYARVTGLKPNLGLELLKVGNFTADIALEHAGYLDVKVKIAAFEVKVPSFNFNKLVRNVGGGTRVSTDEILGQMPNLKSGGYQLKSITVSDGSYARVTGVKPNLGLELLKVGNFTADILLEYAGYLDVTVKAAAFEVKVPSFNFSKSVRNVGDGTKMSADEILRQVPDQ